MNNMFNVIRHRRRECLGALLGLVLGVLATTVQAHSLGSGYVFLNVGLERLHGEVQVTLEDLDKAFALDADGDGKLSEQEAEARIDEILTYLADRIAIGTEDRDYDIGWTTYEYRRYPEGKYLAYLYEVRDPGAVPDVLRLRYELLFDVDPAHRGYLVIPSNEKGAGVDSGEETTLGFSPDRAERTVDVTALSMWTSLFTFIASGVWHIWIGIDHILFLVALILPAVLLRRDAAWAPVQDFGPAFWNVVKIVTLFTLAHTITLSLAALDVVRLPSRLVESVIAASVVVAAINNLVPVLHRRMGWIVFGFGLFHGFGFASVLAEKIQNRSNIVVDLLGFNIGVELGQIAIIVAVFPILFAVRGTRAYLRGLFPVGSVVIGLLALGWLVERALDVEFLPI
ncbi:MAG: HupE/UreJ family protein [Pseudomonadota bacterium]